MPVKTDSLPLTARPNIQDLANIRIFMRAKGVQYQHLGTIVNEAVSLLASMLSEQLENPIRTNTDAVNALEDILPNNERSRPILRAMLSEENMSDVKSAVSALAGESTEEDNMAKRAMDMIKAKRGE